MFCGSASGFVIPPMLVYEAKYVYEGWANDGVPGAVYTSTPSGWFNGKCFFTWFEKCFLPAVKHLHGPKVLLGDNVSLHMNPDVFRLAKDHDCHFIFLPANGTHLFQPLDVGVFGPLKKNWRPIVEDFVKATRRENIPKEQFPKMVKKLYTEYTNFGKNLKTAFKACGIVPFDPQLAINTLPQHQKPKKPRKTLDLNQAAIDTWSYLVKTLKENKEKCKQKQKRGKKSEAGVIVGLEELPSTSSMIVDEEGEEDNEEEEDGECDICHRYTPPLQQSSNVDWIGCIVCDRWFHHCCLERHHAAKFRLDADYTCENCK